MIRKVLIMNKQEDGRDETCGLLSLEENTTLSGRLRIYNLDCYDNLVLSLKIGENKLLFNDVKNPENFLFSTIYHNLSSPICAVVASVKNGRVHICASGHSENDRQNPESLFDDFSDDKTLNELKNMIDEEIEKQEKQDENLAKENVNKELEDEKLNQMLTEHFLEMDKEDFDKQDSFNKAETENKEQLKKSPQPFDNTLKNTAEFEKQSFENLNKIDTLSVDELEELEDENVYENDRNIEEIEDNKNNETEEKQEFIDLIYPQLNELFSNFPHCDELEQKIEDSRWVSVTAGSQSYVLGEIFDEGQISHICYGMPAKSVDDLPPKHLKKYCQWLPLDLVEPTQNGYWVMYQDAKTGQTLVIDDDL